MPGPGKTSEASQQVSGEEVVEAQPPESTRQTLLHLLPQSGGGTCVSGTERSTPRGGGELGGGPVARPPEGACAQHVTSAAPDQLSRTHGAVRASPSQRPARQLWGPVSDHPSSPIQDFKSSLDFEGGPFSGKTQLPPDCDSGPCPALPSPPQPRSHPFPSHPFRAPFLKAAGSASKWPCHLEGVESRDRP